MSAGSSSGARWFTPPAREGLPQRADDVRLGQIMTAWDGEPSAFRPRRPVVLGFPQDEGVRRNGGRPGAALAPGAIRSWLYRLTAWDAASGTDLSRLCPLDLGDLRTTTNLEEDQANLGAVVAAVLAAGAVPVVLGGGHETAYGHYLGYAGAKRPVAILNIDAHLDVRPLLHGQGHSGSP